jgi:hypothetical protein
MRSRKAHYSLQLMAIITILCSTSACSDGWNVELPGVADPIRSTPSSVKPPAARAGDNHQIQIVPEASAPSWVSFDPPIIVVHVNDSVTWVNDAAYECRLSGILNEVPQGDSANPVPKNGGRYTITFTRELLDKSVQPEFSFRCANLTSTGSVITVQ